MDVKLWNDSRRRWKRGKGFTHFKQYMDKHMQHIRHFWSYMHGPPQYNKHIKTFNKKHLQLIIFLFSSYLLNSLKQTPPVCHLKSDKTNSQKKSYLQMPRTVCWCSGDAQHTGGGGSYLSESHIMETRSNWFVKHEVRFYKFNELGLMQKGRKRLEINFNVWMENCWAKSDETYEQHRNEGRQLKNKLVLKLLVDQQKMNWL